MNKPLPRDQFREAVFARDGHKCVVCGAPAQDAHHLLERRLWADGGYHLDNGVSLCGQHHIEAERTTLSVEDLREAAGITNVVLPDHFLADERTDKWGNVILPTGARLRGELWDDESFQKIIDPSVVFENVVKYPRTYHLPWSPGRSGDDKTLPSTDVFRGKEVVVTTKMDGENTSFTSQRIYARSIDSRNHPSRNYVKRLWSDIAYEIPEGWRVCGENVYAKHSLAYENLPGFFLVFSIWDEKNRALSWDDTRAYAEILGLPTVDVLWRGVYDEKAIQGLWEPGMDATQEGYVVRVADSFAYRDFRTSVAKYVRASHVVTHAHWMHEVMTPNKLSQN